MEAVEDTKKEILAGLSEQSGLAYPKAVSILGHPLHWHPHHRAGNLLDQLRAFVDRPLQNRRAVDATAHEMVKILRKRFSIPENPFFSARQIGMSCEDKGNFRALDSDGDLPSPMGDLAVPDEAASLLDAALLKAGDEFDHMMRREGLGADQVLVGDIVGFATWCFWRCP